MQHNGAQLQQSLILEAKAIFKSIAASCGDADRKTLNVSELSIRLGDFGLTPEETEVVVLSLALKGQDAFGLEEFTSALGCACLPSESSLSTVITARSTLNPTSQMKSRWIRHLQNHQQSVRAVPQPNANPEIYLGQIASTHNIRKQMQRSVDKFYVLFDGSGGAVQPEVCMLIDDVFPYLSTLFRCHDRYGHMIYLSCHDPHWKTELQRCQSEGGSQCFAAILLPISPSPQFEQMICEFILGSAAPVPLSHRVLFVQQLSSPEIKTTTDFHADVLSAVDRCNLLRVRYTHNDDNDPAKLVLSDEYALISACDFVVDAVTNIVSALTLTPQNNTEAEISWHLSLVEELSQRQLSENQQKVCDEGQTYVSSRGDGAPFVITTDVACGSSTVAARIAKHCGDVLQQNAHERGSLIVRFIGASQGSLTLVELLRSLCIQCATIDGQTDAKIGCEELALAAALPTWFKTATKKQRRLIIVLDGIDRLQSDHFWGVNWLPHVLPTRVHLIVTVLKGSNAYHSLTHRRNLATAQRTWLPSPHLGFPHLPDLEQLVISHLLLRGWNRDTVDAAAKTCSQHVCTLRSLSAMTLAANASRASTDPLHLSWNGTSVADAVTAALDKISKTNGKELTLCAAALLSLAKEGLHQAELEDLLSLDDAVLMESSSDKTNLLPRIASTAVSKLLHDLNEIGLDTTTRRVEGWLLLRFASPSIAKAILNATQSIRIRVSTLLSRYFSTRVHDDVDRISGLRGSCPQPLSIVGYLWSYRSIVNRRRLSELYNALLLRGDWQQLGSMICDIEYVEAKCRVGQLSNLLAELSLAIKNLSNPARARAASFRRFLTLRAAALVKNPEALTQLARDMPIEDDVAVAAESAIRHAQGSSYSHDRRHYLALGRQQTPSQLFLEVTQEMCGMNVAFCEGEHGESMIACSSGNHVVLYDAITGHQVASIHLPVAATDVLAITVHPLHPSLLVTAGDSMRLWDLSRPAALRAGEPTVTADVKCTCVGFSPSGMVLSAGGDCYLKTWRTSQSENPWSLLTSIMLIGYGSLQSVAYTQDSKWAAAGTTGGVVYLCDPHAGSILHEYRCHSSYVWSVVFSKNGDMITAGHDGKVARWNPQDGSLVKANENAGNGGAVLCAAMSRDESKLAIGCEGGEIRLISTRDLVPLQSDIRSHPGLTRGVCFSSQDDGDLLVSCSSEDRVVRIWSLEKLRVESSETHQGAINSVVFSEHFHCVITAGVDGKLLAWNPSSGELDSSLSRNTSGVHAAINSHAEHQGKVAVGTEDGSLLWFSDFKAGRGEVVCKEASPMSSVAISPDGCYLASICTKAENAMLLMFALKDKDKPPQGPDKTCVHQRAVTDIAWDWRPRPHHVLATASLDQQVKIWKVATGEDGHVIMTMDHCITLQSIPTKLGWNPQGSRTVIVGDAEGAITEIDGVNGSISITTRSMASWSTSTKHSQCSAIKYNPSASRIAVGFTDSTVKILESNSLATKLHLQSPYTGTASTQCSSIAWAGGDDTVAVAFSDGRACLWQVWEDMNELHHARHEDDVRMLLAGNLSVNDADVCGWRPLHCAAVNGLTTAVRALTAETWGAILDIRTNDGSTPLELALMSRKPEVAEVLLSAGAASDASTILMAIKQGYTSIVKSILDARVSPDSDFGGESCLEAACGGGHAGVVNQLLKYKASIQVKPDAKMSPIALAARGGSGECIKVLVGGGAEVDTPLMPLHIAAEHPNVDAALALINAKADINRKSSAWTKETPLHRAAAKARSNMIKLLVQHKADINATSGIGHPIQVAIDAGNSETALALLEEAGVVISTPSASVSLVSIASRRGMVDVVKRLISLKAEVQSKSWESNPLHEAANAQVVAALLDGGVDLEMKTSAKQHSKTALLCAATNRHYDVIVSLIEAKANIQAKDENDMTLLHCAVGGRAPWPEEEQLHRVVELCVQSGISVNAVDRNGRTPLHFASTPHSIELLLAQKADPMARDKKKKTVLHTVCAGERGVQLLVNAGARVNADDVDRQSPLLRFLGTAAGMYSEDYIVEHVTALLAAGADPNCKGNDGSTPLGVSRTRKWRRLETLLLSHGVEDPNALITSPGSLNAKNKMLYSKSAKSMSLHAVAASIALRAFSHKLSLSRSAALQATATATMLMKTGDERK